MESLILIPDISGFTEFVNSTEIEHSRHIVAELLDLIIEEDELGLRVAEIEGDAVLFFKWESVPTVGEIIAQARRTFIRFHAHLKEYETKRICSCGACRTAHNLTLKFVAHAGPLEMLRVREFEKPHGPDLIVAHRLLKNDIASDEYLLITNTVNEVTSLSVLAESSALSSGSATYDDVGEIEFHLLSLEPLLADVPEPEPVPPFELTDNPVVETTQFKQPLNTSYEFISNLAYRLTYNQDLDDLRYTKERVNRVGTRHECLVNGKPIGFDTIAADFGKGNLVYGERPDEIPLVRDAAFFWILDGDESKTTVRVEVHYHPKDGIGRLLAPLFRLGVRKTLSGVLSRAKRVAENDLPEALKS